MEFVVLVAFIFGIIALQNKIYSVYGFRNLDYRCTLSTDQACEGDEIELIEEITNKKILPLPWFKTEITTSKWLDFAGAQSVVSDQVRFVPSFFMLKSYQKVVRRWKVTCLKRGEYEINHVVLISTDLLGYGVLSMAGKAEGHLIVLPRPLGEEMPPVSPRYLTGDLVVRRHLVEDPFVISGVREYTSRDGMNQIHWGATAKEQKLMVYNRDSTSQQSVSVILNMQSREFEGNTILDKNLIERAIRVAAGLFDHTLASGMPLRFFANTSVSGKRETIVTNEYWGALHVQSLLELLARLPLTSTEDFPTYLADLLHTVTSTDIFIVTGYLNEGMLTFARRKQAAGSTVRFLVLGTIPPALDTAGIALYPLSYLAEEVSYDF